MDLNNPDPFASYPSVTAFYQEFWAWKISEIGVQAEEVGDVTFKNMMLADCALAAINVIRAEWSKYAKVEDVTIVGQSKGNPPIESLANGKGIQLARADWLEIKNVEFHNMNGAAMMACSSCENICQRR